MRTLVADPQRGVTIEAIVAGKGPDVVLFASALRGADDFALLQEALAEAGFRSVAINMRGAGRSKGPEDYTFEDLADDVAGVIEELCDAPVHLVGHAQGNIVARGTAAYRPELVRSVTVMPCGGHNLGKYPVAQEVIDSIGRCHDEALPEEERRKALGISFFAPGNDPGAWLGGWWPGSAGLSRALLAVDPEVWWRAGGKPMLIVQPLQDPMSPRRSGIDAAGALDARYVEVPRCGHAILPEQPEAIAEAVIAFLREQEALAPA